MTTKPRLATLLSQLHTVPKECRLRLRSHPSEPAKTAVCKAFRNSDAREVFNLWSRAATQAHRTKGVSPELHASDCNFRLCHRVLGRVWENGNWCILLWAGLAYSIASTATARHAANAAARRPRPEGRRRCNARQRQCRNAAFRWSRGQSQGCFVDPADGDTARRSAAAAAGRLGKAGHRRGSRRPAAAPQRADHAAGSRGDPASHGRAGRIRAQARRLPGTRLRLLQVPHHGRQCPGAAGKASGGEPRRGP